MVTNNGLVLNRFNLNFHSFLLVSSRLIDRNITVDLVLCHFTTLRHKVAHKGLMHVYFNHKSTICNEKK